MTSSKTICISHSFHHPSPFPTHIKQLSVVKFRDNSWRNVTDLNLFEKFFLRNHPVISITTEKQQLVFRQKVTIHGNQVSFKLTMLIAPDHRAPNAFLNSFWRDENFEINTGLLVSALQAQVRALVCENLSFVDLPKVPIGAPIKSAARHSNLSDLCHRHGIHLFFDELVLEKFC